MIYLDYSATTVVDDEVLKTFNIVAKEYVGNPNSLHNLGIKATKLIDEATEQVADILKVKKEEIIWTSGASEANNLAIKGIALKYKNRGKHIITTKLEHSSIYAPLSYLESQGYEIDFVPLINGLVDIKALQAMIREDTILVSISFVNSEIGIKQDIQTIGEVLTKFPKCFFHVDMTQAVGKISLSLENVDLASLSAHKFYGLKGSGMLIKKAKVSLEPLIHGGKSTTIYRSGTPATELIASTSKALRLANENIKEKFAYVLSLNGLLREKLKEYKNVRINSPEHAIPHILNFSILGVKPETFQHALGSDDIYISTQTACHSKGELSIAVLTLTSDEERASTSLRISLSFKTTKEEIDAFLVAFANHYHKLVKEK